jgi:hypothetical protein
MTQTTTGLLDDSTGPILPSQYNDLVRRRSGGFEGERRLLWAVLENAIDTYLANVHCTTAKQRDEFDEVNAWFSMRQKQQGELFSFRTICDMLEIDGRLLLTRMESICERETRANVWPSAAPQVRLRPGRLAA